MRAQTASPMRQMNLPVADPYIHLQGLYLRGLATGNYSWVVVESDGLARGCLLGSCMSWS